MAKPVTYYTVIDRQTDEPDAVGLSAVQVAQRYVEPGKRQEVLALLEELRPGGMALSLGPIVVSREEPERR